MNLDSTNYIKQHWEKEANTEISDESWLKVWETQSISTKSLFWRNFCWKNLIRFFITPNQKSKFVGSQQSCWRECGSVLADNTHTLLVVFIS